MVTETHGNKALQNLAMRSLLMGISTFLTGDVGQQEPPLPPLPFCCFSQSLNVAIVAASPQSSRMIYWVHAFRARLSSGRSCVLLRRHQKPGRARSCGDAALVGSDCFQPSSAACAHALLVLSECFQPSSETRDAPATQKPFTGTLENGSDKTDFLLVSCRRVSESQGRTCHGFANSSNHSHSLKTSAVRQLALGLRRGAHVAAGRMVHI